MPRQRAGVKGLEQVLANLDDAIEGIEGRTQAGMNDAGFMIQREAQKLTPVDTGNLKNSAYTNPVVSGPPAVSVGFTAAYALAVHEDLQATHEVGEAKFLEKAIQRNHYEIIKAVADRAEV